MGKVLSEGGSDSQCSRKCLSSLCGKVAMTGFDWANPRLTVSREWRMLHSGRYLPAPLYPQSREGKPSLLAFQGEAGDGRVPLRLVKNHEPDTDVGDGAVRCAFWLSPVHGVRVGALCPLPWNKILDPRGAIQLDTALHTYKPL